MTTAKQYMDGVQDRQLLRRGWEFKDGFWSRPGFNFQGLPYLFTREQAIKAEGLVTVDALAVSEAGRIMKELIAEDPNISPMFRDALKG